MKKIVFASLTLVISLTLSLAVAEFAYRLWTLGAGPNLFKAIGDGEEPYNLVKRALPVELHPQMGWTLSQKFNGRPNIFNVPRMTVLDDLTRSNGKTELLKEDCRMVAVGDSFTFGDEVSDEESWPAHLEKSSGCRVFNGGVCAYGIDQSYLRAVELLKSHRPQTLLLGLIWDDVWRAGMDIRQGLPKPYFTTDNDELKLHPIPPDMFREAERYVTTTPTPRATVLRYSYLLTHLLDRFRPQYWLGKENHQIENNSTKVACLLMQDLDRLARAQNVRFAMVAQYNDNEVLNSNSEMHRLISCLKNTNVEVIDTFKALKSVENDIYRYYFRSFSHMTGMGNKLIADTVLAALKQPPPPLKANPQIGTQGVVVEDTY